MADSPWSSRPSSRAQSDASFATAYTERPDSSASNRTLGREIDHIKSLINRSQNAPSSPRGSITAQVFRQRSSSTPVTTQHIINELDQLKRRLKNEQHQLQLLQERRNSDADPETESEAEDVPDEREEELERAREEVHLVRQRGEQLLEAAERRVDDVTSEMERLQNTLANCRNELDQASSEKRSLKQDLQKSQKDGKHLKSQIQSMRDSLNGHRSQLEQLQAEGQKSEASHKGVKEQMLALEALRSDMEMQLAASNDHISQLEDENRKAADQLQQTIDKHSSRNSTLEKDLETLQARHSSITIEAEKSKSENQDLQKKFDVAEFMTSQMKVEYEARCRALVVEIDQHKKLLEDALKDVDQHTKEFEQLYSDRHDKQAHIDKLTAEVGEYQVKLGSALFDQEQSIKAHQKQLKDVDLGQEQRLQEVQAKHVADRQQLECLLVEAKETHAAELHRLKSIHATSVEQAKAEQGEELDKARAAHAQERLQLVEEHSRTLEHAKRDNNVAVREREAAHQEDLDRLTTEHSEAVARMQETHEENLKSASGISDQRLQQLEKLQGLANDASAKVTSAEAQNEDLKKQHAEEINRMKSDHATALEETRKDGDNQAQRLIAGHAKEIEQVKSEHQATRIKAQEEAQTTHQASVDAMRKAEADRQNRMQRDHEEALRSAEQARKALEDSHNSVMAEATSRYEAAITASEVRLKKAHSNHGSYVTSLNAELLRVQGELQNLKDASERQQKETAERDAAAETRLVDLREVHARQLTETTSGLTSQVNAALSLVELMQTELTAAKAGQDQAMVQLRAEHGGQMDQLRFSQDAERVELQSKHDADLDDLRRDVESTKSGMAEAMAERETAMNDIRNAHAQELKELKQKHDMESQHSQSKSEDQCASQIDDLKASHQAALKSLQAQLNAEIAQRDELVSAHEAKLHQTQLDFDAHVTKLRVEHGKELEALHGGNTSDLQRAKQQESILADLEAEHASAVELLKMEHGDELLKRQTDHESAIATLKLEMEAEATIIMEEAEQQHRAVVEAAVDRARQHGQAEVKNLKKRHQDAVAQLRRSAEEQSGIQLLELEANHKQQIQAIVEAAQLASDQQMQSAMNSHQGELSRLQTDYQSQTAEMMARLEQERDIELASRQHAFDSEVAALQARLDASLTGQAETERSLAKLRRRSAQADEKVAEAKSYSEEQIMVLQQERDDLASRLEQMRASPRTRYSNGSTTPKSKDAHEEIASVQAQLAGAEEERVMMQLTLQKHVDEKAELSRQNDFLVKELEALLAQRTRPKMPPSQKSDAQVQTESWSSEPKTDLASVKLLKEERRKTLRPTTPLSPERRQAKEEVDRAWEDRSFEDYNRATQPELARFDGVVSANETLFAQKIKEHVGELQRARDQLVAEYKAKLDLLAADRDQIEQTITSKHAAEFARERRQLVATYGADVDDWNAQVALLTSLPTNQAVSLRSAEQQLVHDYNKRISKRKSQIALKHAAEFQIITQEYDKKIAELLDNVQSPEANLSTFEKNLEELEPSSASLRAKRTQSVPATPRAGRRTERSPRLASTTPQDAPPEDERRSRHNWTSHPRTARSIPRSASRPRGSVEARRVSPERPAVPTVPFTEGRNSPQTVPQPRRGSVQHVPAPQRSLMRAKYPMEPLPNQRRVVTEPSTPRMPALPPITPPRSSSRAATVQSLNGVLRQHSTASANTKKSSDSSPGILRKVRAKIADVHMPNIGGHRASSSRSGSSRPVSLVGMPPVPQIPADVRQSSYEAVAATPSPLPRPASSHGVPKWRPSRTKSKKLSSGLIYYQPPGQAPAVNFKS